MASSGPSSGVSRSSYTRTVKLHRAGTLSDDGVEVSIDQITPRTVSSLFNLNPSSIWLQDSFGSKVFFPDPINNTFSLPPEVGVTIISLRVEGSVAAPIMSSTSQQAALPGPILGSSSSRFPSRFSPVVQSRKEGRCSLRIVQADVSFDDSKKPVFSKTGQVFIDINDTTANINYITSVVKQTFGTDYVVVTADGLKIYDSAGTQGLKFWKTGSRKLFAIKANEVTGSNSGGQQSSSKRKAAYDVDSDDLTESKRSKQILTELKGLRKEMNSVMRLTRSSKLPPGLRLLLTDTFKCSICRSLITPPVAYSRCCQSIVGCEKCLDMFYSGDEGRLRSCPLCRRERAVAEITRLNGLNDFLTQVKVFDDTSDDDGPSGMEIAMNVPRPPPVINFSSDDDAEDEDVLNDGNADVLP